MIIQFVIDKDNSGCFIQFNKILFCITLWFVSFKIYFLSENRFIEVVNMLDLNKLEFFKNKNARRVGRVEDE